MKSSPTSPCAKARPPRRPAGGRGFTLIEVMTSVVVLAMLLGLLSQLVGTMTRTSIDGQHRVNNFTKGRAMLDLFAFDIQSGVFRADLAAFPADVPAFYTRRSGVASSASSARELCLVQYGYYQGATSATAMTTIRRGDLPVLWNSPATSVSFGNNSSLPQTGSVTPRDTAPGVVAFKILFIGADGTFSTTYAPPSAANPSRAVGMTLAVIDDAALEHLTPGAVAALRSRLDGAVTGRRSALADWEQAINASGFGGGVLSKDTIQRLKIFERYARLPDL